MSQPFASIKRNLVVVILSVAAPVWGGDWPTYHHDSHRSGRTPENLPAEALTESWVYRSLYAPQPAWAGPARWDAYAGIRGLRSMRNYDPVFHPIVVGARLYYGSTTDDALHCLDARTGEELWQYTTDGPIRIAPSYAEGRLYFGSDDGYAYCVSADRGELIWKFSPAPEGTLILHNGRFIPFWPCRTGVLVDGGTAYFAMGMLPWKPSFLCAVDALTGQPEGDHRYVQKLDGVSFEGALLASSRRIISPQGRVAPLLFERDNGAPLGALEGGGGCFVLLTEDAHILHGPGNKTGWIQESAEEDRSKVATFAGGNALVVAGDRSYLLSDGALAAMRRTNRRELWRVASDCPYALILAGRTLYAAGEDKVAGFDISDGRRVWEAVVDGKAHGLAVADGALFVSTDTGAIHCFRATATPGPETATPKAPGASAAAADDLPPLAPVASVQDDALLGRWVFQRPHVAGQIAKNLAMAEDAQLSDPPDLARIQNAEVIECDGASQTILITDDLASAKLPKQDLTVEAWVRVDQPLAWGGIIGCIQDNGDYERGWLLGYVDAKFALAVAGQQGSGRLTYLQAASEFRRGQWYHVLGTYDGRRMRLYVDGQLSATSEREQGPIAYPPQAFYEIGAYHDQDEHYRLTGAIREVRVYHRVLEQGEVLQHAALFRQAAPTEQEHYVVAVGPCLTFEGNDRAVIWWQTAEPMPTLLEYSMNREKPMRVEQGTPKTHHTVTLSGLKRDRMYSYRLGAHRGGKTTWTEDFECDTFFNYNLPPINDSQAGASGRATSPEIVEAAERVLSAAEVRQGVALVIGCKDGQLAVELARRSQLRVVAVDTDPGTIEKVRQTMRGAGIYGVRAVARRVSAYSDLPFIPAFASLLVSEHDLGRGAFPAEAAVLTRHLKPYGGVALVGHPGRPGENPGPSNEAAWIKAIAARDGFAVSRRDGWTRIQRLGVQGAGIWSHQYGTAANAAYGGESLQDASGTGDLEVQWVGRPGPRAQPDRNGRKPAPLSTQGRLFVQGLHRVIALDAFNGSVLWSREIPPLQRFNMPRDCGNWCADDASVFLAIRDRCWRLSAATGDLERTYATLPGKRADWDYDWAYLSVQGDRLIGSSVKQGSAFADYWGGSDAGWYDATSGPATFKVCSEKLFACDKTSGSILWEYEGGLLINATITIAGGQIYFLENRHPKVNASEEHRIGLPQLWEDLHLVALNLENGKRIWERPIAPAPGIVVVYLAHAQDRLTLVTSGAGQYHVYGFLARDGSDTWSGDFPWPKDNHGGHMSRPAIVGGRVFVRPKTFDLVTGQMVEPGLPAGGCGSYAAADRLLVYRDSNVSLWNTHSGAASSWSRLRPDCWLSTIPAEGLLLSPEAGGGCSCGSWLETSIAFRPRALN